MLLHEITEISKRERAAQQAKQQAQEIYQQAKAEKRAVKGQFISAQLTMFLQDMQDDSWKREQYIRGSYTSDFTKFISRNYGRYFRTRAYNERHQAAIEEYTAAFENLNRVFLELLENNHDMQQDLINYSNLKNLNTHNK